MLKIPTSPNYHKNLETSGNRGDNIPCIVCGKGMLPTKATKWVHVFYGTDAVTPDEADAIIKREGSGGDMNFFPVGADCLRKHPELRAYVNLERRDE